MEINSTGQTSHVLSTLKTNMLLAYLTLYVCFFATHLTTCQMHPLHTIQMLLQ
jgi:hypothetical protein